MNRCLYYTKKVQIMWNTVDNILNISTDLDCRSEWLMPDENVIIDYGCYDSGTLKFVNILTNKIFKIGNVPRGVFNYFYISPVTNLVYKLIFCREKVTESVKKAIEYRCLGEAPNDLKYGSIQQYMINNVGTDIFSFASLIKELNLDRIDDEFIQGFQEDLNNISTILDKELDSYLEFIKSTQLYKNSKKVIDFGNLDLTNCKGFRTFVYIDECYKVVVPKLDLRRIEMLRTPFGDKCKIGIYDFSKCINDLELDDNYFDLHLNEEDIVIIVVKKDAKNFKTVLMNSNPHLRDNIKVDDIDLFYAKNVLLNNKNCIRHYIVTV